MKENPFKNLKIDNSKFPKIKDEFLEAIKYVQKYGKCTKRTKEWIEKVEHITAEDLGFIIR